MGLRINSVKGTRDILPGESYKRAFVENVMRSVADYFGFEEIRTPVFEYTELFNRSVGETTDVVQKEMYTFDDKSGRSITLRPEGTAGVVRSMLENGLYNEGFPLKLSYVMSCYRYEKPQAGRYREFNQFGAEMFGSADPSADAELIFFAHDIFQRLSLRDVHLRINSIGCQTCRAGYHEALKEYFRSRKSELCHICIDRLERNPMRILDCKSEVCSEVSKGSPMILDYLCDECKVHFEAVKAYLADAGIEYEVDPQIVRGLDYYTRTVFEFTSQTAGIQSALGGGGRYDSLVEELGGQHMPALGFGIGIERVMSLLDEQNVKPPERDPVVLYIVNVGEASRSLAMKLTSEVRKYSMKALYDVMGRGVKAQMKYADKVKARFSVVIGDAELESSSATLKDMHSGTTTTIPLDVEKFGEEIMKMNLRV